VRGVSPLILLMGFAGLAQGSDLYHLPEVAKLCRPGTFPHESRDFELARVRPAGSFFYRDSSEDCPENPNCKKESAVDQGELVVISRAYNDFSCSWDAKSGSVGWLKTADLEPVQISTSPALRDWAATWVQGPTTSLEIRAKQNGSLEIVGRTCWSDCKYSGSVSLTGTPDGNHLLIGDDDCALSLVLLGNYLVSASNHECGGADANFCGVYVSSGTRP